MSKNASGPGNKKFGKTDTNIAHGMSVEEFAERAAWAIFLKKSEVIISKDWYHYPLIWIRNMWPELVFKIMNNFNKKELKNVSDAK